MPRDSPTSFVTVPTVLFPRGSLWVSELPMLKLAMASFDGDELRRLTDEASKQALREVKESGIEMGLEPFLSHWPLLVSEN